MKIKINEEYQEVNMWSFIKCHLIATILVNLLIFGGLFALGFIFAILGF